MATKKITVESRNYGKNTILVEAEDASKLQNCKLSLKISGGGYSEPSVYCVVKGKRMLLHQFLLGSEAKGKIVRYKNKNRLDFTRKNLVVV